MGNSVAVPKKSETTKKEVPTADLLDFDEPAPPPVTRNRAVSHAPHPKMLELFEGEGRRPSYVLFSL